MKTRQEMEAEQQGVERMQELERQHPITTWTRDFANRHTKFPWVLLVALVIASILQVCHGSHP